MTKLYPTVCAIGLAIFASLAAMPASAQWAAEPGATVRNGFGPEVGANASQCRGACGGGCPKSCTTSVSYECADAGRLRKITTYDCGTHQGCRVHDDCLDRCLQSGAQGGTCQQQCDNEAMARYGFQSMSWLTGGGPYDGRISFEYTRDAPSALEPAYGCPDGTTQQCSGTPGCVTADGAWVEPVFDAYPGAGAGAMQVSAFRSGPACGEGVCEQSTDIKLTGADTCSGGSCTRFGMEFDYKNADPAAPLECTPSTSGGGSDFIGDLAKQGADAMESRGQIAEVDGQGQDGMAELMGVFAKVLASGDSPEDIDISMAPLDEHGNPIESQRVGSTPAGGLPPIPRTIELPAKSGHLFVPMYQLTSATQPGVVKERRVRCTHKGVPVLETVFRLQPG